MSPSNESSSFYEDKSNIFFAFINQFGARKDLAKEQLRNGVSINVVFDQMFLNVASDLSHTLSIPNAATLVNNDAHRFVSGPEILESNSTKDKEEPDIINLEGDENEVDRHGDELQANQPNTVAACVQYNAFPCHAPFCGIRFPTMASLIQHRKETGHRSVQYRCKLGSCGFVSTNRMNAHKHVFYQHMKLHSMPGISESHLSITAEFISTIKLDPEMEMEENDQIETIELDGDNETSPESVQPSDTVASNHSDMVIKNAVIAEDAIQPQQTRFECDQMNCTKGYRFPGGLRRHRMVVHRAASNIVPPARPSKHIAKSDTPSDSSFRCKARDCKRSYKSAQALDNHLRFDHLGPFSCGTTPSRPFVCPHPVCGQSFMWVSSLQRHLKIHRSTTA